MHDITNNFGNSGLLNNNNNKSSQYRLKVLVSFYIVLLFITSTTTIVGEYKSINYANASDFLDLNLDQTIQQFQNNLQQSIEEQVQSSINNSNYIKNDCEDNNNDVNISIQSQTNRNGQTSSIMQNYCADIDSISFPNMNLNLAGHISSAEYDVQSGYLLNSLLGNWSLTNNQEGSINFESFFIKSPVFYKLSGPLIDNVIQDPVSSQGNQGFVQTAPGNQQQQSNTTSYNISNFRVNSINLIDSDKIFQGKVDLIKQTVSNQTGQVILTNTFYNVPISLAILNNNTLIINFDKQTDLSNDFKNIPLVGVVISR